MKQLHILLGTAIFFTAVGFLLGQQQQSHKPVATEQPQARPANSVAPGLSTPVVKAVTAQQASSIAPPLLNSSSIKTNTGAIKEQSTKGVISATEFTKITQLLALLKTDEERVNTLNTAFETNPIAPATDADSAINLSEFFRRDKTLEKYIPQQVSCHSNMCKVDLSAVDATDINHLMEILSDQLREHKLNASHILLAQDTPHGSTQLYVSLQTDGDEKITE